MDVKTTQSKLACDIKENINVCCWTDKICSTCYWYDPGFKGGWCNKNKHETASDSGCSSWGSR